MAEYIKVSDKKEAKAILSGFKLISLTVKNADTGKKVWKSENWGPEVFTTVKEAHFPKSMLTFSGVGREIVFRTKQAIKDFRISQDIVVHGKKIEQWDYTFGFVMPDSENSWETIVQAAGEGKMLPAEYLSGNMYILTNFYSGNLLISRSVVRVFYD